MYASQQLSVRVSILVTSLILGGGSSADSRQPQYRPLWQCHRGIYAKSLRSEAIFLNYLIVHTTWLWLIADMSVSAVDIFQSLISGFNNELVA